MIKKLTTLYAQNGKFHTFVVALEFGLVGFFSTYTGGLPTSKEGLTSLATGIVGALWGAAKGWLRNNVSAGSQLVQGGK